MDHYCTGCGQLLRSKNTPAAEKPGSRVYSGAGQCWSCRNRHRRKTNRRWIDWSEEQRCTECGAVMHNPQRPETKTEGSVAYGSRGRCDRCRNRFRRGADTPTPPSPPAVAPASPRQAWNKHTLATYLTRRRQRLAHQARLTRIAAAQAAHEPRTRRKEAA